MSALRPSILTVLITLAPWLTGEPCTAQSWLLTGGEPGAETSALVSDGTGLVAVGTNPIPATGGTASWIAALDSGGDPIWSRAWTTESTGHLEVEAIAPASEGGWIVAGSHSTAPTQAAWLRIAADGSLIDAWQLEEAADSVSCRSATGARSSQPWLAVVATLEFGGEAEVWLLRLDSDGQPDLRIRFGPFAAVEDASLTRAPDGTLFLAASVSGAPGGGGPLAQTLLASLTPAPAGSSGSACSAGRAGPACRSSRWHPMGACCWRDPRATWSGCQPAERSSGSAASVVGRAAASMRLRRARPATGCSPARPGWTHPGA